MTTPDEGGDKPVQMTHDTPDFMKDVDGRDTKPDGLNPGAEQNPETGEEPPQGTLPPV